VRGGGWGDLATAREAAGAAAASAPAPARPAPPRKKDSAPRRPSNGRLAREVSRLEARIAGLEADLAGIEAEVEQAGAAGDIDQVTVLGERHRAVQDDLSYAMAEWEDRAAMLAEGR